MTSILNRIDKLLKTKEDLQSFVLVMSILFILFVKCYMVIVYPKVGASEAAKTNTEKTKTLAKSNS